MPPGPVGLRCEAATGRRCLEAAQIAETITDAFPLGPQPATREVDGFVVDRAPVLSPPKPEAFLKGHPARRVTQVDGRQ